MKSTDISAYIRALSSSPKFGPQVVFHKVLEPSPPAYHDAQDPVHSEIGRALKKLGITRLYSHQIEALELIRQGKDVVVATPTASGKSLVYNIPVIENHFEEPQARALYLFPLKALSQDQQRTLTDLYSNLGDGNRKGEKAFSAVYDGDTKPSQRARLRKDPPPVIITNPDMVHLSLLPYHDSWSEFFRTLKFVIIDEIHTYRGLFGSHMAWVLRRLIRLAHYYGAEPRFIMLSATVGNPEKLGSNLIGRNVEVIDTSGAPTGKKNVLLLNPWDSGAHATAQLLEAAVKRGLRTIVYTKSRRMTELITMWTRPRIGELADRVCSYRAGFLPEDRRSIESRLASGDLIGVISTSALELGIDIGDLDLCILVGYPGSIMATWQRSGRVGRRASESAVILVAGEDALDQYFMRNPDDFFGRFPEHAPLNPLNSKISGQHLHCAAAELPLLIDEPLIADTPAIVKEIELLTEQSVLHQDADGSRWYARRKRPQQLVGLRGGGVQLSIIDQASGEVIGEIDSGRAMKEAHPGAVYLHHSRTLLVGRLDIDAREIVVDEFRSNYHTRAHVHKETEILETLKSREVYGCILSWGRLKVIEQVTGFSKVNNFTQKVASTTKLELPEQIIETEGMWLDLKDDQRKYIEDRKMHFMGAIHAIEHAMIAMFPLLILCDRNDIGGISCPHHHQTDGSSIFIYDGYGGGAGLTEEAYNLGERLLDQTLATIRTCTCENGCPSCVHSPKCGSGNRPIDKDASRALLQLVIDSPANSLIVHAGESQNLTKRPDLRDHSVKHDYPKGVDGLPDHYCVFDLETKLSAQEVGGWSRAGQMGMSVGVVYDSQLDGFVAYLEDEVEQMIDHLFNCQLVVGFNCRRFDYRVLSSYTDKDLYQLPTLDILEEINNRLGYRLSLDRLAEETLGAKKTGNGLLALQWYREGKLGKITDYCREDVNLTNNLFLFALESGHLLFRNKAGRSVRVPLKLDRSINEILASGG